MEDAHPKARAKTGMHVKHFVSHKATGMRVLGASVISGASLPSCELSQSFASKYLTGGSQMSDLVICCSLVAPDGDLGGGDY